MLGARIRISVVTAWLLLTAWVAGAARIIPPPMGWDRPALQDADPFTTFTSNTFDTDELRPFGSLSGWSVFDFDTTGLATAFYDPGPGAYVARIWPDPNRYRISGVVSNFSEWLPYGLIGPDRIVRAKYYMYHTNQTDPLDASQIPNLRVRVSFRFAVNSMLEVFHHLSLDPANEALCAELRPSSNPSAPSLYRVDMDPVDIPALWANPAEGVLRIFEAYALEPQENGDIGMTECVIGTYPAGLLFDPASTGVLRRVLEPNLNDAGSLALATTATELTIRNVIFGTFPGDNPSPDWSDQPRGTYTEAGLLSGDVAAGITLDTQAVPTSRVGIVSREFHPGPNRAAASYVRMEPGRQYSIRWHLTSTQQANLNAQIRLRARSLKFAWSQKFEIGGARSAGAANNLIAGQSLPGIGTGNADRIGTEHGGWYTLLMHTPLSLEIRPEYPPGTPLQVRMPLISSEPGPNVDAPSRRDLFLGLDLIDTFSQNPAAREERGRVSLDRIEVRVHDLVPD
ncbi:MAG: hypothetical protein N2111_07780 [Candidatus Sumerlaeaceae bacterium]|nr:hypothetical protein [Candidatus Sumerlaeaceae bacterium]